MRKQVSPVLIGAFVVGAVLLGVAALMLLGSGKFFKDTTRFVLFFSGSVDGLEVGAPVRFKGVTIGAVTEVRLALEDVEISEPRLPVFIEIDNRKLRSKGGGSGRADAESVGELVTIGLRAQLRTRSLLTGLLFVQLDLRPDVPVELFLSEDSPYDEIPTMPAPFDQVQSAAERILARLDRAKIDDLVNHATDAIDGVNRLVSDPALKAAIETLPQTLANLNEAAGSIRTLSTHLDTKAGPVLESTRQAAIAASEAMQQARATLQSVQLITDARSPLSSQLEIALSEFSDAARSVKLLAQYLERDPSSLVRGRDATAP